MTELVCLYVLVCVVVLCVSARVECVCVLGWGPVNCLPTSSGNPAWGSMWGRRGGGVSRAPGPEDRLFLA